MKNRLFSLRALSLLILSAALAACSSTQVTTTQPLSEAADAPYDNVLVIFLASKFDSRRYLETELVKAIEAQGAKATASTSMMDSRTPLVRQTFVDMVEEIGADAVLVTQVASLKTTGEEVSMNPQSTHNFRPTHYYNLWEYELTEYVEPKAFDVEHELLLASQLYSTQSRDVVWAIEAESDIVRHFDELNDYSIYVEEADAITSALVRGGLITR